MTEIRISHSFSQAFKKLYKRYKGLTAKKKSKREILKEMIAELLLEEAENEKKRRIRIGYIVLIFLQKYQNENTISKSHLLYEHTFLRRLLSVATAIDRP